MAVSFIRIASCISFIMLALCASPARATDIDTQKLQGLGDVRHHTFTSAVLERDLHLFVRLPPGYQGDADHFYPVVYLLDGGVTFPLLSGYYHYLTLGDELPPLILVGIAYGSDDFRQGNMRSTDYTAPTQEREYWGGAERFAKALRKDVLPFVEDNYRTNRERRIIFGQSLGGQFVLFAAMKAPGLFFGHIASNPALHRNLAFFLDDASPAPKGTRVFVASGANDDPRFRVPALKWIDHWRSQASAPWELKTVTLEGQSHFSAAPAAFRQGMDFILQDRAE